MIELLSKGGYVMWFLLGSSIIALAVFLERFSYYHRIAVYIPDLLQGIANLLKKNKREEAIEECSGTPGPAARVVRSILLNKDADKEDLRAIAQQAGQLEVPRIERYLSVLLTIAYLAPLIGLLGTVIGLIDIFHNISQANGLATTDQISRGVYQSLISSAAGLVVAIPTYLFYTYLASSARNILHDIERAGIETLQILSSPLGEAPKELEK